MCLLDIFSPFFGPRAFSGPFVGLLGLFSAFSGLGAFVVPFVGSGLLAFFGPRGLFWAFCGLLSLFLAFCGPFGPFFSFLGPRGFFWAFCGLLASSGPFLDRQLFLASQPFLGLLWASGSFPNLFWPRAFSRLCLFCAWGSAFSLLFSIFSGPSLF